MIANLGMYDASPLANDAFWLLIRRALGYGPETLTRVQDMWPVWQSPDLLFAQTCGYPYRAHLHGSVHLIGTPDYGVAGCPPGFYASLFIARRHDPRQNVAAFDGARFAFNEPLSQSGWAAPVLHMTELGMRPGALEKTGSHAGSLNAVVDSRADFAAVDAVSWAMASQSEMEFIDHLHVIAQTTPTPGLPYITALTQDAKALRTAVRDAIDELPTAPRRALMIKGLIEIPAEVYLGVPTPLSPAEFSC